MRHQDRKREKTRERERERGGGGGNGDSVADCRKVRVRQGLWSVERHARQCQEIRRVTMMMIRIYMRKMTILARHKANIA